MYFQMVCQKLCQNSVSGWGSQKKKVLKFTLYEIPGLY